MRSFKVIVWIAGIIMFFILFSCKGERRNGREDTGNGRIELTYWCSPNPQEIQLAEELVGEWNKMHPDIQVRLQPIPASQSSEEVLLAAIAGGTTPDICSNIWPGAINDFISAGGMVALDQFEDFYEIMLSRMPEDLLASFRAVDGHYYQIPWKTNPIMMFYNVRLFQEAGIEKPPATYSEYLSAAAKITKDLDGDGRLDRWMGYRDIKPIWWQRLFDYYTFYLAASGGNTLFREGEIAFNNQFSIKVFSFFQELYEMRYFPRSGFQGDAFLQGKIATQFTGPWSISYIEKFKPADFEYDVAPIPVPDDYSGKVYTYGDPKNIAIFSTTRFPQEAFRFACFLISRKSDLRLLEICTQIPIRKDLTTDSLFQPYFTRRPMIVKFAAQAPYTRGVDPVPDLKEVFDIISQEYEACAVYNTRTPEEAVRKASERVRVIMEWNRE